jgi:hypothetical protein
VVHWLKMLSSEFENYFDKVPCLKKHFEGVFSIDNFPKNIKVRSFFVCNMSKSNDLGTHWISIVKPEPKTIEIFDSLGTKIDILRPYLKFKNNPTIVYNVNAFQTSNSSTCGFFAIFFLVERCFNFDLKFKEVLAEIFDENLEINEKQVVDFCENL